MKKFVFVITFLIILSASINTISAQTTLFTDIDSHWAKEDIIKMEELKIARGKEIGKFDPGGKVTRAEFTAFILRAMNKEVVKQTSETFTDVKKNEWYFDVVEMGYKENIFSGYPDGRFQPNKNITREEMASILIRALNLKSEESYYDFDFNILDKYVDKADFSDWSKVNVSLAVKYGFLNGYSDDTFLPKKDATRAESIVVIKRFYEKITKEPVVLQEVNMNSYVNSKNESNYKISGIGTPSTNVYLRSVKTNSGAGHTYYVPKTITNTDGTFEFIVDFSKLEEKEWNIGIQLEDEKLNKSEEKIYEIIKDTRVSPNTTLYDITDFNKHNYRLYAPNEMDTYKSYTFKQAGQELIVEVPRKELVQNYKDINFSQIFDNGEMTVDIYVKDLAGNEASISKEITKRTSTN